MPGGSAGETGDTIAMAGAESTLRGGPRLCGTVEDHEEQRRI
ncbi:hypothetical protein [Micromonospora craterilacus]|nr:hypothetical protein [Micromonospora craterilacus]